MRGRKSNRRVQEMLILKEMLLGLPRKRIELRSTGQPRAAVPTQTVAEGECCWRSFRGLRRLRERM